MGVYYLAELVEEFTMLTKRVLTAAVKTELVVHALLLVIDRGPFLPLLVSAVAQASYLRLLPGFPFLKLTSESALTSAGILRHHLVLRLVSFIAAGSSPAFNGHLSTVASHACMTCRTAADSTGHLGPALLLQPAQH